MPNEDRKRRHLTWTLATLLGLAVLATAEPAHAVYVYTSPYGASPVNVKVASDSGGNIRVCYFKIGTAACECSLAPQDNLVVYGSPGNDTMAVMTWSESLCGLSMFAASYTGRFIDLFGADGHDTMTSGWGDTHLHGQFGNDQLWFQNPFGYLGGDYGNDKLWSISNTGSSDGLYGGEGDDCLDDWSRYAAVFSCGNGTDKFVAGQASPSQCETSVSSCF
jgi:hypothetical protein